MEDEGKGAMPYLFSLLLHPFQDNVPGEIKWIHLRQQCFKIKPGGH